MGSEPTSVYEMANMIRKILGGCLERGRFRKSEATEGLVYSDLLCDRLAMLGEFIDGLERALDGVTRETERHGTYLSVASAKGRNLVVVCVSAESAKHLLAHFDAMTDTDPDCPLAEHFEHEMTKHARHAALDFSNTDTAAIAELVEQLLRSLRPPRN